MNKNLKETIVSILNRKILSGELDLDKGENNTFIYCIVADYRDSIKESVKDILNSDYPRDYFYNIMLECYLEHESNIYCELITLLQDELDELGFDYTEEDDVRDIVNDIVDVHYPYDHYLNEAIAVNLVVDTGDGNYDFTLNHSSVYYPLNFSDEQNNSSILWLARQQGYSKKDLKGAINYEKYKNSVFLKSVDEEIANTCTHMNALTFLLTMTFGELLNYYENEDTIQSITVSKDTTTGLVDYWSGGGSIMGIELEKDVVVPREFVDSLTVDGCRGIYGIKSIYSFNDSEWNGEVKLNYTVPMAI